MYLKSLKLTGFKSFADRTRLELRPGVTVIVGPNGSGKSNIVDAVAWVMGTQSTKSLRTDKMDDVIFAGTATRPGLGRAEVTLILDNSAGVLPLDLGEVSLTRRLYRDGSSDYEINGVACRLLDIQELLSDSGVGRHQHVIIGQGQIDKVLNAGPDEHRAVIEEAAGILKHRIRKDKAIRRLERTDADVLRLHDLLGEITRQMRPLKRQAEAATRYDEVATTARCLRLFLGGEELRVIAARRSGIDAEQVELATRAQNGDAELAELGGALTILRRAAGEVGEALDRDTSAAARLETTIERLRRISSVAHERARAGRSRLDGADERRRDLTTEREHLTAEAAMIALRHAEARRSSDEAEARFRALEDEERSLADQEGMSVEGAVAVARGDLRSLDGAESRDTREIESIGRRLEGLAAQADADVRELTRVEDEIKTLDVAAGEAQTRYSEAESARKQAQGAWEEAEAVAADARVSLAAASAKLDAVEQAVSGLADPEARALVEAATGALGSLTSLLDVPEDLAAAVDAALGPWSDAVAFVHTDAVADTVGTLKGAGRGGVPMVAAGVDRTPDGIREAVAAAGLDLVVDRLGPSCRTDVARALLGDVVLAEGWAAGWRFSKSHPQIRVVTPEGDLITADGVRVAHPDGATPAMVETAGAAVEAAETDLARARSVLHQAKRAFDEARTTEREALEGLESIEVRLGGAVEAQGRLTRTLNSLDEEKDRLSERKAALETARSSRTEQRLRLIERLEALEGEEAERQKAWDQLVERREAVARQRELARAEWQETTASVRGIAERRTMVEGRLSAIAEAIDQEVAHPVDPESIERLGRIEDAARQALDACKQHLDVLRERQAELRGRVGATGTRMSELQRRHDEISRSLDHDRDRKSELAVETAELRVRYESVAEALRRDADASEDDALSAGRPSDYEGHSIEELRTTFESAQAELRRMGPINPLAATEYQELSERHTFMTDQLSDLETSRDELRKVIKALDVEIQERFAEAFAEVAAAYEEHFAVLFPGGRGRLRLTDSDEPLTSGVEIEAQPLGKKVAKMTLLSGGERSLAALAFLFAIFKARPSPFYVLDEVEAALDDANLRRFLRLLDAFRGTAQLMVVTHQQQTMETADVLYGVTMEPGGSSKVVAKALSEVGASERETVS
ncbi:MAG: chromosome segregation protein SMC [Acidimicrobiia bacterium]|nr:chromosome segregation protein SMC [Acidimicrobiia bacterium]